MFKQSACVNLSLSISANLLSFSTSIIKVSIVGYFSRDFKEYNLQSYLINHELCEKKDGSFIITHGGHNYYFDREAKTILEKLISCKDHQISEIISLFPSLPKEYIVDFLTILLRDGLVGIKQKEVLNG